MEEDFPKESKFGYAHSTTIEGKEYDVYKLIEYGNNIKPIKMETIDFSPKELDEACWNDLDGKMFSPRQLLNSFVELGSWGAVEMAHPEWADHIEKVRNADHSYPILIYKFEMIDGMHRLLKAYINKIDDIYVRVIDKLSDDFLYKPEVPTTGM
jgi:hypothetical protein